MKQKELFTIIIASLLALLIVLFFYTKKTSTITTPQLNENINIEQPEEEISIIKEAFEQNVTENPTPVKEATQQAKDLTVFKEPTKNTNKNKPEPNQSQLTKSDIIENTITTEDTGVIQEKDSNVIVITREYKSASPAKYSFK